MQLEICANSIQSALAAQAGGANRIELCQNLEEGGITPSYGLIQEVIELLTIPVFVLVRPRPGDFVYDEREFSIMYKDILACKDLGCKGVVTGALDSLGKVDKNMFRKLVAASSGMQLTFHRAFDDIADKDQALEEIIELGFHRILTSGGAVSAIQGFRPIRQLLAQSSGRIKIMPGAGINSDNILTIAEATGAEEFHASAKKIQSDGRYVTDIDEVKRLSALLQTSRP